MSQVQKFPAVLQAYADAGIQALKTNQAAAALNLAPQTLRKWACYDCAPMGVRPRKFGRAVRWDIADIARLIEGASHV